MMLQAESIGEKRGGSDGAEEDLGRDGEEI